MKALINTKLIKRKVTNLREERGNRDGRKKFNSEKEFNKEVTCLLDPVHNVPIAKE